MSPLITVRAALPGDANGIARVHVQAWREAYAHLVPAETLARLDVAERAARWETIIADDHTAVFVALENSHGRSEIVGWASTSAGRDAEAPRALELEGIYVLASHHGTGTAQTLLDASIAREPTFLWMAADNPRALAFYERNGFVADGATEIKHLEGTPVAVVRLVR